MDDHLMAMERAGVVATLPEAPPTQEMSEDEVSAADETNLPENPEDQADLESADVETEVAPQEADEPEQADDLAAEATDGPVLTGDESAEVDPSQVVEALLFASDSPLSAGRLAELVGAGTPTVIRKHVKALNEKYADAGLTFRIDEIAGGFRMLTLPVYRTWLLKLNKQRSRSRLTPAALETLSIIAYKQPIIRAEVDAIRGVACGEAINRLREMGMVKIVGRAEMVGRPMLYGTTRKFLDTFGLANLDELPPLEALTLRPRAEQEPDEAEDEQTSPAAASA